MFLPSEYLWLEPVLIATAIVFVADMIGNTLSFSNRLVNAIVTAVVLAIAFGAAVKFGYADLFVDKSVPSILPSEYLWLEPVLVASAIVFVVGLIGNILAFGSRFVNALVTAIIFAIVFGAAVYYGYAHLFVKQI